MRSLNVKTVLFQAIQFSIRIQFCSIQPTDKTLSGATTPGKSEPRRDKDEGVLRIPLCSSITGTSPSDCFMLYPGHSLGEGVLPLCRDSVSGFYSPSRLGHWIFGRGGYLSSEVQVGVFTRHSLGGVLHLC